MEIPPTQAQSEFSVLPTGAIPSGQVQSADTFSVANAAPDDAWTVTSKITPLQDREILLPEPDQTQEQSEPSADPEPVPSDSGFSLVNAEPDEQGTSLSRDSGSMASLPPVLSTNDQFQAYVEAGQHSEAEEWLSRLVTAQPDHAEARELFGALLEATGDTAGAALQYSRALELLLADSDSGEDQARQTALYAKVKELAPASPLVAKWLSTVSPKPEATVPAVEIPISAESEVEIDPETHYTLGVAYKNMGLLDEAKEEFCLSMKSADFFLDSCLMIAVCLKEQGEGPSAIAQLELLLKDQKCQGAKGQAIRYELGLLYETQEQWSQAAAIYESIPNFHDVPLRLESIRSRSGSAEAASTFRYGN
jgi:tetratricopeptide (TPR) repeat protein